MAAVIFTAIFGIWWLVGLKHQFLIFGPGIAYVRFGPVWQSLYPLFAVSIVAEMVRQTIALLRPGWEKGQFAFRMFVRAINLVVLYFLLNANDLIILGDGTDPKLQPAMRSLNQALHLCIVIAAVITIVQTTWELYSFLFRRNGNGQAATACL